MLLTIDHVLDVNHVSVPHGLGDTHVDLVSPDRAQHNVVGSTRRALALPRGIGPARHELYEVRGHWQRVSRLVREVGMA